MSGNLNQVNLIGHLGRDPEAMSFADGGEIVKLSVGTTDSWRDRQTGERRQATEWHNVVLSAEGLIGLAKRYLRKGSKVFVQGKLSRRSWRDQLGNDRFAWDIKVGPSGQLLLLDRPRDAAGGGEQGEAPRETSPPADALASAAAAPPADLDDDVPF